MLKFENVNVIKGTKFHNNRADPVYTLYNQFNKNMMMIDLESVKDVMKFLNKLETIIDTSVIWE